MQVGATPSEEEMSVDMKIGAKHDWKYTWTVEDVPTMHCFGEVSEEEQSNPLTIRTYQIDQTGQTDQTDHHRFPLRMICTDIYGEDKLLICITYVAHAAAWEPNNATKLKATMVWQPPPPPRLSQKRELLVGSSRRKTEGGGLQRLQVDHGNKCYNTMCVML